METSTMKMQAVSPFNGIRQLIKDSYRIGNLRISESIRLWRSWLAIVFTLAIVGDMLTTVYMMSVGTFQEANPLAATAIHSIGLIIYVCSASCLMLLFCALLLARPRYYDGWTAQIFVLVAIALKVGVVVQNLLVLFSNLGNH